jgi:hypothetical protein
MALKPQAGPEKAKPAGNAAAKAPAAKPAVNPAAGSGDFAMRIVIIVIFMGVTIYYAALGTWLVGSNRVNHRHLAVLQSDKLLDCRIGGVAPLRLQDENAIGSARIGQGANPTAIVRLFRLHSLRGADRMRVIKQFAACAQKDAWALAQAPSAWKGDPELHARKTLPEGWSADLLVSFVRQDSTPRGYSDLEVYISTPGV